MRFVVRPRSDPASTTLSGPNQLSMTPKTSSFKSPCLASTRSGTDPQLCPPPAGVRSIPSPSCDPRHSPSPRFLDGKVSLPLPKSGLRMSKIPYRRSGTQESEGELNRGISVSAPVKTSSFKSPSSASTRLGTVLKLRPIPLYAIWMEPKMSVRCMTSSRAAPPFPFPREKLKKDSDRA